MDQVGHFWRAHPGHFSRAVKRAASRACAWASCRRDRPARSGVRDRAPAPIARCATLPIDAPHARLGPADRDGSGGRHQRGRRSALHVRQRPPPTAAHALQRARQGGVQGARARGRRARAVRMERGRVAGARARVARWRGPAQLWIVVPVREQAIAIHDRESRPGLRERCIPRRVACSGTHARPDPDCPKSPLQLNHEESIRISCH